jgi:hypothetical protein
MKPFSVDTIICSYCQQPVLRTEILSHIRNSHERTLTTQCKYCPKYIQNRNMNTHIRKYHSSESVAVKETPLFVADNRPASRILANGANNVNFLAAPSVNPAMFIRGNHQQNMFCSSSDSSPNTSAKKRKTSKVEDDNYMREMMVTHQEEESATSKKRKCTTKNDGPLNFSNLDMLAYFASSLLPM